MNISLQDTVIFQSLYCNQVCIIANGAASTSQDTCQYFFMSSVETGLC
jgi:hypothetical protein